MRQVTEPLSPEMELMVNESRKDIKWPGSDCAVNPESPVVTGEPVMDTQLENMRRTLCARVWSVYQLVQRAKGVRLWMVRRKPEDHAFPPSLIKRDDHPMVQVLIQQALELAKIDGIDCQGDPKLELLRVTSRLRALSDIQSTAKEIERLGSAALVQAQDLIKAFHQMAQQYRIHRDKIDAGSDRSDIELLRIASQITPGA